MDSKQREIDQAVGVKPEDHVYRDRLDPRHWIPQDAAIIEQYDPAVEHMPIGEVLIRLEAHLAAIAQDPDIDQIAEFAVDLRAKLQDEAALHPEPVLSASPQETSKVLFDSGERRFSLRKHRRRPRK